LTITTKTIGAAERRNRRTTSALWRKWYVYGLRSIHGTVTGHAEADAHGLFVPSLYLFYISQMLQLCTTPQKIRLSLALARFYAWFSTCFVTTQGLDGDYTRFLPKE
jgi:hypothetical protein